MKTDTKTYENFEKWLNEKNNKSYVFMRNFAILNLKFIYYIIFLSL